MGDGKSQVCLCDWVRVGLVVVIGEGWGKGMGGGLLLRDG